MGVAVKRAVVVGAGIVGLSCAWFLQEHGVEVEVVDRDHVAAGSSWGNAGYVTPALTVPLTEPSILRYAIRAILDPGSAVCVPLPANRDTLAFLVRMARKCTSAQWRHGLSVYRPLNEQALAAYDRQRRGGVNAAAVEADILAAFERAPEAQGLMAEVNGLLASGQSMEVETLTGAQARDAEPHLSDAIALAVRIRHQRYITPATYVAALAQSFTQRGGTLTSELPIASVYRHRDRVVAAGAQRELDADVVVIASGAWLDELARPHGVTLTVHAGRGYSFNVPCDPPLRNPVYLMATRIAITPRGNLAHLAGVMEFTAPDAALHHARIASMVQAARPLLRNIDLDARSDEWVGARPLSADGVPLVGATRTPGVYVAGGHGMWGVALGPLTGQLLADAITSGVAPAALAPLDPLR